MLGGRKITISKIRVSRVFKAEKRSNKENNGYAWTKRIRLIMAKYGKEGITTRGDAKTSIAE